VQVITAQSGRYGHTGIFNGSVPISCSGYCISSPFPGV